MGKKSVAKSRLRSNEDRWGYLFLLPWMIGFAAFFAFPMIVSIMLSLGRVTDVSKFTISIIGFGNYSNALFRDINFVPNLIESTKDILIKMPVVVIFSLFIAILLNRNIKFKGFFRVAFFLPVLLGTGVVMSTINGSLVTNTAQIAAEASTAAIEETSQASSSFLVMLLGPSIAVGLETILQTVTDVLWMSGIQIIIFLGALQTIPESLYEAAFVDGASEWEKFWKITLPLTMPSILLNAAYTMIDYLSSSENVVVEYCRKIGFDDLNLGLGSAFSWLHFLVSGLLVLIVFLVLRPFTYYADE